MMTKLAPYKRDLPYAYAPGIAPSHALLDARPGAARRLLVHSSAEGSEGVTALRARCEALRVRAEVADHALSRVSRKENCFAAIVFDKYESTLSGEAPHVVLHQPSDMGNLGTALRACLGFGLIDIAIIRPSADLFDPRVVRASMGALFAMRAAHFDSFDAYRAAYPNHALYPFMLDGALPLSRAAERPEAPFALVFGNEATGLPAHFAAVGQAVRIPHGGQIDSLNLSVAVSIAAYAFTARQFEEHSVLKEE
ncbi:MAG: TrmH family RNA methyltransferase [Firmicutes bacterium]|nr:TrmH family RNA methyltransferase [Bacillota bacterium]